jgi:hypothetical protein
MSDDIVTGEIQKMKKTRPLICGGFVFFLSMPACLSCGQKEKVIQRAVVEIPGIELELKNPALYKTWTRDGREIAYLSTDFAAVPKPGSLIDKDSREFRFYNRTSTDDHLVHLVGYKEMGDHTWFLIKNSWQTAYEGKFSGYFFYRDDDIKLKSLTFLTHQDAVAELLQKFEAR